MLLHYLFRVPLKYYHHYEGYCYKMIDLIKQLWHIQIIPHEFCPRFGLHRKEKNSAPPSISYRSYFYMASMWNLISYGH